MSFADIPKKKQKLVQAFLEKFRKNPKSSGINYEKIKSAKVKTYRSVRIDQDYRGIIQKPDCGNVYLLLFVGKHDDAYDWANNQTCAINEKTGGIQISGSNNSPNIADKVDYGNAALSINNKLIKSRLAHEPSHTSIIAAKTQPLFQLSDDQLIRLGLPLELLAIVRNVCTDSGLEAIESKLPVSVYEALYQIAAGDSWEDIEAEYVTHQENKVDTTDFVTALRHPESQRLFHVLDDDFELKKMLEAPLEHWRVFLHPSQEKLVNRHWNGPVCVLGGAGTGKTVVAMHRAKWLAGNIPETNKKRILFTTFSAALAMDIQNNLCKICTTKELERIEVKHINQWVSDFLKNSFYAHTIIEANHNELYKIIWAQALRLKDSTIKQPDSFYREEWDRIIVPNQIYKQMSYLSISREGRGVALTRMQRSLIWPVFEELRAEMTRRCISTFEDAALDAINEIKSANHNLAYSSAIIDEGQDMGPEALALIRQIVPEQANDLFIVGDGHQRIYRQKTTMSSCGIKVVGRSHKLKINYRTTEQTQKFAMSVLENTLIDDLDGKLEPSGDCVSLIQGPKPIIKRYNSLIEEADGVSSQIAQLIGDGVKSEDICIVARNKKQLDQLSKIMTKEGMTTTTVGQANNLSTDDVRLATMSRVKGLEFHYVFITSVNEGLVPLDYATSGTEDPVELRLRSLNERALFHVACTRAVKQLYVSSSGEISSYLVGYD